MSSFSLFLLVPFLILFVNQQNVYSQQLQQENIIQSEIEKKKTDLIELRQFLSYLNNIGTIGDICGLMATENTNDKEFMKLCLDFVRSVNNQMEIVFKENSELISQILN
jgi:hypothetical protein